VTTQRLNIGMTGFAGAGGSGVVAGELGRHLARRGHSVHFIADAPPFRFPRFAELVHYHEVVIPEYPPIRHLYTLALAAKMADVSRRFALDVLHVHYALPHTAAALLARSMLGGPHRPRLVTTLHGTDVTLVGSDPSLYEATSLCIGSSHAVTTVSQFLRRAASTLFPGGAQIEVIPNFVDCAACSAATTVAARSARPAAAEELLLVHLSNFRSVKRPADTVRILAAVNAVRPARLLLIGDGPEMPCVLSEVERLDLRNRVQLVGNQIDVQTLLSPCDVFLLPSAAEGFGLAALEAMACGVPAVTSDAGGLAELIENGRGGYAVAVGDVESMAARVLDIVADPATLELHRAAARARAASFDAEVIVPLYESLYLRTLA
jgi:N-acetyl-alpha-D-glucosaminyl L-malate synthase BshA